MYLNYVYDMDRHGGLVTAEPHWARNENAHAVVSVRKAGKEMKEMTHTYVVYVQLTKKGNICLVGNRLLLLAPGTRARVLGGPAMLQAVKFLPSRSGCARFNACRRALPTARETLTDRESWAAGCLTGTLPAPP